MPELFRDGTLELVHGDITTLDRDVIVNAANASLTGGGGVDGAIHRAAGPELLAACRDHGRASTGQAVRTPGFRLVARYVVHAVGPVWEGGHASERTALQTVYRESLRRASEVEAKTIAFPCISTGAYRFPFDAAMAIAISTVDEHLDAMGLDRVTFCCFAEADLRRYRAALTTRFP